MCVTSFHIGSGARTRIQPPWREIGEESKRERASEGIKGWLPDISKTKRMIMRNTKRQNRRKRSVVLCSILFTLMSSSFFWHFSNTCSTQPQHSFTCRFTHIRALLEAGEKQAERDVLFCPFPFPFAPGNSSFPDVLSLVDVFWPDTKYPMLSWAVDWSHNADT